MEVLRRISPHALGLICFNASISNPTYETQEIKAD